MSPTPAAPARRADAERNRERILAAARTLLASGTDHVSMAEVARRADVGMATLYRNFPGRRELLEALYRNEVDALCRGGDATGRPDEALRAWLLRFAAFHRSKHPIAAELLRDTDRADPLFGSSRDRVLAAGGPLLLAAQDARQVRADLTIDQVLDLVLAASTVPGDPSYVEPILNAALDGLVRQRKGL